jgi:hypothetical protein
MSARRRAKGRLRSDAGVVEFTSMFPLIVLTVVLVVWEAFLIGMAATFSSHAANEGARAAAVGASGAEVEEAAIDRISGMWADEENIDVHYPTGDRCRGARPDPDCGYVRVTIKPPLLIPGVLLPMDISARTKIVYEGER